MYVDAGTVFYFQTVYQRKYVLYKTGYTIDEVSTGGASRTVLGADCAGMMIVSGKKTKQHNDAICLKYRIYVEFILIWALRESSNSWQI